MRNISLIIKQFSRSVLVVAGFAAWGFSATAQAPAAPAAATTAPAAAAASGTGDAAKGEAIFKAKCTSCHKIDVRMTGPALGPQLEKETDDKWLTKWIQNNQALIAAKDNKAMAIYAEYNQSNMTVFADLSDGDVANILAYVRGTWKTMQTAAKAAPAGGATTTADSGPSNLVIFGLIGVIILAFIIILVLNKVIGTLERLLLNKQGLVPELVLAETEVVSGPTAADNFKKLLKNKKLVFFALLAITVAGGSWQWTTLWNTNVHTGYQPVQPIKYSHQLHAGVMKIDCQYCHGGAYKSKNATIPSLNVCMNCHKVVKTESPEIHKIYDALGYDPATQKYDTTKARPIQWVRVHNLPDLVYFNHSQHVVVGKVACQTCHGPIQEMQEVRQYSPLTMKWCIQCHKRTEVDFSKGGHKGNPYYDNMIQVHDRIKRGEPVTEAALGGLECGKCHY
jgi:mono/diheme cytochrome c family protein